MVNPPVYMDNHATTRVDPRVVEAMAPVWSEHFGNSGSTSHVFGWRAAELVDASRASIARTLNCSPRELVFTSGATESNNLALRGVAERVRRRGNHIVSVKTEHKAVLDPLAKLGRRGFEITLLDVAPNGRPDAGLIDLDRLASVLRDDTLLVSVMLANNEIGVLQPVAEIGSLCRSRGIVFHCDATQAVGRVPVDVEQLQVDLLSLSAHKIYGPKGIGALYVRRRPTAVRLESQQDGGGQEGGLRSGTLNVPGIVGLARALDLCVDEMPAESDRLRSLRNRLLAGFQSEISDVQLNGPALDEPALDEPALDKSALAEPALRERTPCPARPLRLPGNLNCSFAWVDGEALMMSMKDLAVSSGSACTSTNPEPSHVLRALGLPDDLTRASLRFGLGRFNSIEEVDFAVGVVADTVKRLRRLSSMAR